MSLYLFAAFYLAGFLYAAIHASLKRPHRWFSLWIAPTLSFTYAREQGLWLSVLLQIIGLLGITIILIIHSL